MVVKRSLLGLLLLYVILSMGLSKVIQFLYQDVSGANKAVILYLRPFSDDYESARRTNPQRITDSNGKPFILKRQI